MTYKDTVITLLKLFPNIMGSRLDVDNHLFAVGGNGYHWENGELVLAEGVSKINTELAVKGYISELIEHLEDTAPIYRKIDEKATGYMFKAKRAEALKCIDNIFNAEKNFEKYEFTFEDGHIYPISKNFLTENIPNDVKPDWKEAIEHFNNYVKEHELE